VEDTRFREKCDRGLFIPLKEIKPRIFLRPEAESLTMGKAFHGV